MSPSKDKSSSTTKFTDTKIGKMSGDDFKNLLIKNDE